MNARNDKNKTPLFTSSQIGFHEKPLNLMIPLTLSLQYLHEKCIPFFNNLRDLKIIFPEYL